MPSSPLSMGPSAKIHPFKLKTNKKNGLKNPTRSLNSMEIKQKVKSEQIA
jgi:hypothetical protein